MFWKSLSFSESYIWSNKIVVFMHFYSVVINQTSLVSLNTTITWALWPQGPPNATLHLVRCLRHHGKSKITDMPSLWTMTIGWICKRTVEWEKAERMRNDPCKTTWFTATNCQEEETAIMKAVGCFLDKSSSKGHSIRHFPTRDYAQLVNFIAAAKITRALISAKWWRNALSFNL